MPTATTIQKTMTAMPSSVGNFSRPNRARRGTAMGTVVTATVPARPSELTNCDIGYCSLIFGSAKI